MMQLLGRYVHYLQGERNLSPYTVRNYRADVREFLDFLKGEGVESLSGLDRLMLRRYLAWLERRGYARASIARKMAEVRSFFRFLVREGEVARNPLLNLSSPKVEKRLPVFLTGPEAGDLVRAPLDSSPRGLRDRALLELLYAAGLRVSEVVKVDLADVNLERREVRVKGKGSKERVALMGAPAVQALEVYLKKGRPRLMGRRATPALFLNRAGGRLSPRSVQSLVQKYSKGLGVGKRVTPHVVRHTFATHLLDGGADLRTVQELLGHERLATTQVYTHVTQKRSRQVYMASHPRAAKSKEGGPGQD
jgi:integrase/recombinase XerC